MQHSKKLTPWTFAVGLALIAAACGGGASNSAATTSTAVLAGVTTTTTSTATTTTAALAATTTTTLAPAVTTTSVAPTTTTVAPPTVAPGTVLVTNEDGVYTVTLSGVIATAVDADPSVAGGIINYAIDDTQGGIIFDLPG
ncbi:hypothetical protein MNBD_ACTINO02-2849, partial [hydrothermal vent metagenome]